MDTRAPGGWMNLKRAASEGKLGTIEEE